MSPTIDDGSDVLRVVLDTNVLIDSIQDSFSASARIIEAVKDGSVLALSSPAIEREYRNIVYRLIEQEDEREELEPFFQRLHAVEPVHIDVVIDDEEDYKFLQIAAGGQADLLITSDRHLLDVGEIESTRIVRPTEALARLEEETNSEWAEWTRGLGIE